MKFLIFFIFSLPLFATENLLIDCKNNDQDMVIVFAENLANSFYTVSKKTDAHTHPSKLTSSRFANINKNQWPYIIKTFNGQKIYLYWHKDLKTSLYTYPYALIDGAGEEDMDCLTFSR